MTREPRATEGLFKKATGDFKEAPSHQAREHLGVIERAQMEGWEPCPSHSFHAQPQAEVAALWPSSSALNTPPEVGLGALRGIPSPAPFALFPTS